MPEARVASVHDLTDGQMKTVSVGETDVLLSRVDGVFHACGAYCTHYGAPLEKGALVGTTVVCPWHHACFDVASGALQEPPALDPVATYRVRVEGDDVFVSVPETPSSPTDHAPALHAKVSDPPTVTPNPDARTIVLVGGGAAALAAAETLRAEAFGGPLLMVDDAGALPVDRTKLSKSFLAGKEGSETLLLRTETFLDRLRIKRRLRRVTRLDAEARLIELDQGDPIRYDLALVATGGRPRRLDVPGADLGGVHLLRHADDAEAIIAEAESAERAVVVGSGFIGMEAAASLTARGIAVTVITKEDVPFEKVLGADVSRVFKAAHEAKGTRFVRADIERIEEDGDRLAVVAGGERLAADLVLVGIGVTPATDFVEGVEKTEDGGIMVDQTLRAAEGLYAAGDIAAFPDPDTGETVRIEHWRLAQQHGQAAARAMLGRGSGYHGIPFFWTGQHELSLRYVGHADEWDEVVIDGSLDERSFLAYYLDGGTVRAVAAVGRDQEAAMLHARWLAGSRPEAPRA